MTKEVKLILSLINELDPAAQPDRLLETALRFLLRKFGLVKCSLSSDEANIEVKKKRLFLKPKVKEKKLRCFGGKIVLSYSVKRKPDISLVKQALRVVERFIIFSHTFGRSKGFATTDRLTGLYNKAYFMGILRNELRRKGGPVSLLLLDLDNFKLFNDTAGHQAGDRLLRAVGQILRSTARRRGDFCCRYGGEEFCMLLPSTDAENAARIAEQIRKEIEATEGPVTASIGLVSCRSAIPFYDLVRKADAAMYKAKRAGKNRVVSINLSAQVL